MILKECSVASIPLWQTTVHTVLSGACSVYAPSSAAASVTCGEENSRIVRGKVAYSLCSHVPHVPHAAALL